MMSHTSNTFWSSSLTTEQSSVSLVTKLNSRDLIPVVFNINLNTAFVLPGTLLSVINNYLLFIGNNHVM